MCVAWWWPTSVGYLYTLCVAFCVVFLVNKKIFNISMIPPAITYLREEDDRWIYCLEMASFFLSVIYSFLPSDFFSLMIANDSKVLLGYFVFKLWVWVRITCMVVVASLKSKKNCFWDRAQLSQTIKYEVITME